MVKDQGKVWVCSKDVGLAATDKTILVVCRSRRLKCHGIACISTCCRGQILVMKQKYASLITHPSTYLSMVESMLLHKAT